MPPEEAIPGGCWEVVLAEERRGEEETGMLPLVATAGHSGPGHVQQLVELAGPEAPILTLGAHVAMGACLSPNL